MSNFSTGGFYIARKAKPVNNKHYLKIDTSAFLAVMHGFKTCEIRKDDRNFSIGDTLVLRETAHTAEEMKGGADLKYTGREVVKKISHIQRGYGMSADLVVISFEPEVKAPKHMQSVRMTGDMSVEIGFMSCRAATEFYKKLNPES